MTVPEHDPFWNPLASFMFSSTTEPVAALQSVPLTTCTVWPPIAPQAAATGVVGVGEGDVEVEDVPLLPPQAVDNARAPQRILLVAFMRSGRQRVDGMRKRRSAPGREHAGLHICQQLVARVRDVEIAHRQLPDPILRRERRRAFLHRE